MKRSIKSYLVFTSRAYRLFLYLGVPLFCIGIELIMVILMKMRISGIMSILCTLIFAEVVSDTWFLGGIQEKHAEKMDYLKTSARGMSVVKSALALDLMRRSVMTTGIFGVCCLLEAGLARRQISIRADLVMPLLAVFSLSTAAVLITRFFSYFYINVLAGYLVSAAAAVCCVLLSMGVVSVNTLIAIYAGLGTAAGILAVWVAMKKVEGGYYDK